MDATNTANCAAKIEDLTRDAVQEVFRSMLGLEMSPTTPTPLTAEPDGEIVASVGFIGQLTGVICLYVTVSFAKTLTSRLVDLQPDQMETGDMVNDAMGELANMVVGCVKARLCEHGLECTMTIPSIVRGQELSLETSAQVQQTTVGFRHGEKRLLAQILLKEEACRLPSSGHDSFR